MSTDCIMFLLRKIEKKIKYGKFSKTSNTFHFMLSKKMWVIRAVIHIIQVRKANSEVPDQTAFSKAV